MEYCEDTLEDVVMKKRQPPPCSRFKNISECSASWEFFVTMMCDVCRGLEHIHSREMVHRDLKLANILVIFFLDTLQASSLLHFENDSVESNATGCLCMVVT